MKSSSLIKQVKADEWYLVRIKGNHHHFKHPIKPGLVTIPHPEKDIPVGTLRNILKQVGLL